MTPARLKPGEFLKVGFIAGFWAGIEARKKSFTTGTMHEFRQHAKTAAGIVVGGAADQDAIDDLCAFYDGGFERYLSERDGVNGNG